MNFTEIINGIIQYGSVIMGLLLFLVALVTMIVEVIKRLLPKVPTDLVVFLVSITICVLALYIYSAINKITVMWYYGVGAVALGFAVAYAAMFGWDKFTALFARFKEHFKK